MRFDTWGKSSRLGGMGERCMPEPSLGSFAIDFFKSAEFGISGSSYANLQSLIEVEGTHCDARWRPYWWTKSLSPEFVLRSWGDPGR